MLLSVIPASVSTHPVLFLTLTAPSFGPVHLGPGKKGARRACHVRRTGPSCSRWHGPDDPLVGTPIDPDTYDYTGHALFNALAGKLWSATTTEIRRTLARLAGLTRAEFARLATVTFAKVAEYQTRGIVHFHAVIRLDGPDGPASTPPAWATTDLLADAIRDAVARTSVPAPESSTLGARSFAWGRQCDMRPITRGELSDTTDTLTDIKVARYIAKYATKSAEAAGVELPPMACRTCSGTGRTAEIASDRAPVYAEQSGKERVFVGPRKGTPTTNNFSKVWRAAMAVAGVDAVHFHDLRHTGNTLVAESGASLKELMRRMGHSSTRAPMIYQHATDKRDRVLAESLSDKIKDARQPKAPGPATGTRPDNPT